MVHAGRRNRRALWFSAGAAGLLAVASTPVWASTSAVPNLVVTATASPTTLAVGNPLTLTINVTNGGGIAPEPTLTTTLPKGFVFRNAETNTDTECTDAGQVITCPLGRALDRAETARVIITAIPVDPGTFTPKATSGSTATSVVSHTAETPVTVTGEALRCFGVIPTIFGTEGPDEIDGTPEDDVIVGLGGNDAISGGGGNDKICGGDGDDQLEGGSGSDMLDGGKGNDVVSGGAGADVVKGGPGKDVLICDRTSDVCDGGEGVDTYVHVP
jgi:Ca2+-binding RTX toxin-like protein